MDIYIDNFFCEVHNEIVSEQVLLHTYTKYYTRIFTLLDYVLITFLNLKLKLEFVQTK